MNSRNKPLIKKTNPHLHCVTLTLIMLYTCTCKSYDDKDI